MNLKNSKIMFYMRLFFNKNRVMLNILIIGFSTFYLSCGKSINITENTMPLNSTMLNQYLKNIDQTKKRLNIKSEVGLLEYIKRNLSSDEKFYSSLHELCVKPMEEMGYSYLETFENVLIVFSNKKYHCMQLNEGRFGDFCTISALN